MGGLGHLDEAGAARMVDVGAKPVSRRRALARCLLRCEARTLEAIFAGGGPKGEVLATARIAGVQAAKRAHDTVPLCHPLRLDRVALDFVRRADGLEVRCEALATERTGVEMEALCGASAAALTVYDMCKAIDRAMLIGPAWLAEKSGGASGDWRHPRPPAGAD